MQILISKEFLKLASFNSKLSTYKVFDFEMNFLLQLFKRLKFPSKPIDQIKLVKYFITSPDKN